MDAHVAKLALPALALALLVPASAPAGTSSPLDCNPSQFLLDHGTLLAVRGSADRPVRVLDLRTGRTRWHLPPGVVVGNVLVHQDGALLTWFDLARGTRLQDAVLDSHAPFVLVGASQDGRQAVVARTEHRTTTFAVVSPRSQKELFLAGNRWSFDALYGRSLFLVHALAHGYEVRLYDLAANELMPRQVKGVSTLGGTIWGQPQARTASADGRYLFTLYVASNGASMVHELDLRNATAHCIDLPGKGNPHAAATYALVVDPDRRHLWIVGVGYGRVVHIDVETHRVVDAYRFDGAPSDGNPGIAVMAPDGERIAVTDAEHVWFVLLAQRKVVTGPVHVAIAMAYSPDQRHLWVVGERSRVSSLPAR